MKKHFVEGENLDGEVPVPPIPLEESLVKQENIDETEEALMKDETVEDQAQTYSYTENSMECETVAEMHTSENAVES